MADIDKFVDGNGLKKTIELIKNKVDESDNKIKEELNNKVNGLKFSITDEGLLHIEKVATTTETTE